VLLAWNWSLTLDYIRVLIWPAVAVGLLVFVWWHRSKIEPFVRRVTLLRLPGGFEVGFDRAQDAAAGDAQAAEHEVAQEPVVNERVGELEAELETRTAKAGDERRRLLAQLVVAQLALDYERIFRVIFGTQIQALRSMQATPEGVHRDALQKLVDESALGASIVRAASGGAPTISFQSWIGFLLIYRLAENPPPDTDVYKITTRGTGFLNYIDAGRYPPKRF
jgi:hypothetical protein